MLLAGLVCWAAYAAVALLSRQFVHGLDHTERPVLAVLYPDRTGAEAPAFQTLADGKGVRITLGRTSEEVFLATDPPRGVAGQAAIRRGGKTTVVLRKKAVASL